MNSILCLVLGLACETREIPTPVHPPAITAPTIAAPKLAAPKLAAPKMKKASSFDPSCENQPPDSLKHIFVNAARRYPLGATQCELARQAYHESKFDPKAVSPAGAIGISQFLKPTAKELGIDPWSPRQSIFAQARYVLWCRDAWTPNIAGRTHDKDIVPLGLGCYNYGRGAMYKNQKKNGWVLYRDAKPNLPKETRIYVNRNTGL